MHHQSHRQDKALMAQRTVSAEKAGSKIDKGELSQKGNLKPHTGELVDGSEAGQFLRGLCFFCFVSILIVRHR